MNASSRTLELPRATMALVCIVLVWVIFGLTASRYFTASNVVSVASQMTVLMLLATGQMFALVVRGFDISVGAVAALSSTVTAVAFNRFGVAGLVVGPCVGLAAGSFNGVLIARLNVQPIIATLGTLLAARGISLLISDNGQIIVLDDPGSVIWLAFGKWLGFAPVVWLSVAAVILASALLNFTVAGRRILMFGSNPEAAALVGMNKLKVHVSAYQITGVFASLAGVVMLTRAGAGLPTDGAGMELQSIAAAVIGGTSLFGGVGSVFGTAIGAGFVQSLMSGLNISGISPFSAEIAIGAVIIAASAATVAPELVGLFRRRFRYAKEAEK